MKSNLFFSPLEQFSFTPVVTVLFPEWFDFSIINETIIVFIIFYCLKISISSLKNSKDNSFNLIPTESQIFFEIAYKTIISIVAANLNQKNAEKFFPILFTLYFFIVVLNLVGLIPYSFTLTSHLIVTLTVALFVFLALNIICIRAHGLAFFSLFLPSGTSFFLALLLVPIELISYIFKPISLSVRLFANMMAGHTLLKVIAGFGWILGACWGTLFLLNGVSFVIVLTLFFLELAVAIIQSCVFLILICIYLNDAINLH